jgi:hypothetical protein
LWPCCTKIEQFANADSAHLKPAVKVLVCTKSIAARLAMTHVSSAFQAAACGQLMYGVDRQRLWQHLIEMRQAHDEWCKANLRRPGRKG